MIGMGAGSDMHKNMQANRAKTRTGKGKNKSLKDIHENYNTYSGKITDKNKMSNEAMNEFIHSNPAI